MNFESIFTPYKARKLTEADIPGILNLYSENTEYFKHCPPNPNSKTVKEDLAALPPAKEAADKYFIGIFDGDSLIAVLDLIDRYPNCLHRAFYGVEKPPEKRFRNIYCKSAFTGAQNRRIHAYQAGIY